MVNIRNGGQVRIYKHIKAHTLWSSPQPLLVHHFHLYHSVGCTSRVILQPCTSVNLFPTTSIIIHFLSPLFIYLPRQLRLAEYRQYNNDIWSLLSNAPQHSFTGPSSNCNKGGYPLPYLLHDQHPLIGFNELGRHMEILSFRNNLEKGLQFVSEQVRGRE